MLFKQYVENTLKVFFAGYINGFIIGVAVGMGFIVAVTADSIIALAAVVLGTLVAPVLIGRAYARSQRLDQS